MRQMLFSLDRMEFQGSGRALVAGRCCGDTMKTGDRAQMMVRVFIGEGGESNIIASEPVALTMPKFLVFNQEFEFLDRGYSGGILLSVEEATGLRLGWYLKGENA